MDSSDKYKNSLSFIDLLFNILLGFAFLFIIAFIMINPQARQGDVPVKAEFLIVMTWPDNNPSDFDLWVMDPQGRRVGFRSRDQGLINLDRDDLGTINDTVVVDGQLITVANNKETVTIRGILPGDYRISVHQYRKTDDLQAVPVTVEVTKINPYRIVYKQTQDFSSHGQVLNYYQFTMLASGEVTDLRTSLENAVGFNIDR